MRIIFSVCYYFVRFDVRIFVEIGFQRSKNPWGCRTELVLKRVFFAVCPLRAQIWRAGGARRCRFFSWILGPCQNGLAAAVRRVSPYFPVLFLTPFSKTSSGPLHIPLFFFGCFFSFVRILLGIGGNAALHICFWAVGLQPFLSFGGFWGLLRKTLFFPLKKGYLGSFLSVSFLCLPFVRPWLLSLLFVTLSLYLSIFLSLSLFFFSCFFFFFFFLVVLYLFLPSLFFCCFFLVLLLRFCFMRRTTSKYYI